MRTHTPFIRGGVLLVLGLITLLAAPRGARADGEDEAAAAKAAAQLKPLQERMRAPGTDQERLRQDLHAFRFAHPGTPAARQAARLLSELPSPLDALRATDIPTLERFDWQPKELVGILGEHRGRHGSPVSCVAYSSDGATTVSGGSSLARLWNASTLRLLSVMGYPGSVTGVALSRDGKILAVGGTAGALQVWDSTKKDKPVLRFSIGVATSPIYGVAVHPNNKLVGAVCYDNTVHIYDVSGKEHKEFALLNAHTAPVIAMAFSPDGKIMASGGNDKTVRLWSINGDEVKESAVLSGHEGNITALAFAPRGERLAAALSDGTVVLWPIPTGSRTKPRFIMPVKAGTIGSMSFTSTGGSLACACSDGTVRLWVIAGNKERAKIEGHSGPVYGVAFAPDNRMLLTGSGDWTVRSWDMAGKPRDRFQPWSHLSHVYSVAFAPDGKTLVSGSEDRIIRLWDLTRVPLKTRNYLKFEPVPVYCVAYSPDGKSVAGSGATTIVRQWDAVTGRNKTTCKGHPAVVPALAYTPDGRRFLSLSGKALLLWDAVKGDEIRRFEGTETQVHCMALSPDGRKALSGTGIHLHRDGKPVYIDNVPVYTDCAFRVWDVEEGKELHTVKSFTKPVYSLGFSADSRQALSGAYEAQLQRWDLTGARPTEVGALKGSYGYVHGMLPSPDGRTLLTRGLDSQVVLWDLETGKRLKTWTFAENVANLALSADSRHLAVSLATGVIYILRLGPPAVAASR